MNPADLSILQAIHQLRTEIFHPAVNLLTGLGDKEWIALLSVLAAMGLVWCQRRTSAMALVVCMLLAMGTTEGLKRLVERERPINGHVEPIPGAHTPTSKSFPSGHATLSMAFYPMIALLWPWASKRMRNIQVALGVLLALFIGFTRLYIGVHWPSDVLVGWAIGGFWALAASQFVRWQSRKVEPLQSPTESPRI
jgi:undecaprenyl-diphosphatase